MSVKGRLRATLILAPSTNKQPMAISRTVPSAMCWRTTVPSFGQFGTKNSLHAPLEHMAGSGAVRGWVGWWQNAKFSPLGSLRKKVGQRPILEVFYFHISLYVCEALVPLLTNIDMLFIITWGILIWSQ